jgi:hypothetical protein
MGERRLPDTDLPWQSETNWKALAIVFTVLAAAFLGITAYSIWLFVKAGASAVE